MSYHRNPGRASRPFRVSKRSGALGDISSWFDSLVAGAKEVTNNGATGGAAAGAVAGSGATSSTWNPANADQATKQAAGCTPIEIVASPGTSPYLSCQEKLKAKAAPSTSIWDNIGGLIGGIVGANTGSAAPPVVYQPASSGISTTTMVVGGVALLGVLYFATKD